VVGNLHAAEDEFAAFDKAVDVVTDTGADHGREVFSVSVGKGKDFRCFTGSSQSTLLKTEN
jgi:hypothetical protein